MKYYKTFSQPLQWILCAGLLVNNLRHLMAKKGLVISEFEQKRFSENNFSEFGNNFLLMKKGDIILRKKLLKKSFLEQILFKF